MGPSSGLPTLAGMKSLFVDALQCVRRDPNLQDALFCTACWLSFAGAVIAAVALPA